MKNKKETAPPSRENLLAFLRESPAAANKREIARAFGLKGAERIAMKELLRELEAQGEIAKAGSRRFGTEAALPPLTGAKIVARDSDGDLIAEPLEWAGEGPAPKIRVSFRKGDPAPGLGGRALLKIQKTKDSDVPYEGRVVRILDSAQRILAVYRRAEEGGRGVPVSRKADTEYRIEEGDENGAKEGELVEIEVKPGRGSYGLPKAKVVQRLGDVSAPRSISLIAIHEREIPTVFSVGALEEAESAKPAPMADRLDLRALPFVTIDPVDARDHDDAVAALPDPDPANPEGWVVWVGIADVAHYVRPGTALDREARKRGNSVYFPDRVVPMLPEALSGDLCSLHEHVERPVIALKMRLNAEGRKLDHQFHRGMIRSWGSLTYEQVQRAADGLSGHGLAEQIIEDVAKPLYGAYASAAAARDRRAPLDLDLPERKVELDEAGRVVAIRMRERLEAHRLIEEFMILANVCAAETLEQKRQALVFRVHEAPSPEKLASLRESLDLIGIPLAKGQNLTPKRLNEALDKVAGTTHAEAVNLSVLRAQAQAYYAPDNLGHFGLNLAKYAHFTSPIRRYADLLVHRALISAHGWEGWRKEGLTLDEERDLAEISEHISETERRAMAAERDSTDRYLAAYLEERMGAEFDGVVSGVARFGLFVKLDETGADGLLPISTLGNEFFTHDPDRHALIGSRTGTTWRLGDRIRVRLVEATPITGGLLFEPAGGVERRTGRTGLKPLGRSPGEKPHAPQRALARKAAVAKAKAARKAKRTGGAPKKGR